MATGIHSSNLSQVLCYCMSLVPGSNIGLQILRQTCWSAVPPSGGQPVLSPITVDYVVYAYVQGGYELHTWVVSGGVFLLAVTSMSLL